MPAWHIAPAMQYFDSLNIPTEGYKAVVFDLDGTLVDSMPAHFEAWQGVGEGEGTRDVALRSVLRNGRTSNQGYRGRD